MSKITQNYKGLKLFANRIDEQLCDVLNNQLSKALEEVEAGLSEKFKPESQAVVMFLFYMLTLFLDRPTPGVSHSLLYLCHSSTSFSPLSLPLSFLLFSTSSNLLFPTKFFAFW